MHRQTHTIQAPLRHDDDNTFLRHGVVPAITIITMVVITGKASDHDHSIAKVRSISILRASATTVAFREARETEQCEHHGSLMLHESNCPIWQNSFVTSGFPVKSRYIGGPVKGACVFHEHNK
jgi:hypothetical protein